MSVQKSKDQYEMEKVRLEVRDLQRTWYFKHIQLALTVTVGVIGMIYAISSGLFDVKRATLTLEKAQLEYDVKVFTEQKANLDTLMRRSTLRNDTLLSAGMALREENRMLNDEVLARKREVAVAQAALLPAEQRAEALAKAMEVLEQEHARQVAAQTLEVNNSMAWKYGMEKQLWQYREQIANLERDTAQLKELIRVKSYRRSETGAVPPWPMK
jgi:hypothetical protein